MELMFVIQFLSFTPRSGHAFSKLVINPKEY